MNRTLAFVMAVVMLFLSCAFVVFTDEYVLKPEKVKLKDGYLYEESESMNVSMASYAVKLFDKVRGEYFSQNDCYFMLLPEKYMYLCDKKSDYDEYYDFIKESFLDVTMIDCYNLLDEKNYYYTDMHLSQEKLAEFIKHLSDALKNDTTFSFEKVAADCEFYGNYAKDYRKKIQPESFYYLTNDVIENLYTKENISIYDFEKLESENQYDFFLSGNQSVVTIENDSENSGKRLVIFRDSFASSIAPLLCESYSEIVLVDLRYIMSDKVGEYVDFENADVLFLYSTKMINSSLSMR